MVQQMIICKFLVISVCISFVLSANLYNSDRTEECDKTAALLHAMHIVPDKENNSKGNFSKISLFSNHTKASMIILRLPL